MQPAKQTTRVDFYLLPSPEARECLVWVCRLVEKAYRGRHRVHLHCRNEAESGQLDNLLWSFRPASFIPHVLLATAAHDTDTPVSIGYNPQTLPACDDVLINLNPEIPAWNSRFQRIAELVPRLDSERQLSRQHFRHYKSLGYQLETHDLAAHTP